MEEADAQPTIIDRLRKHRLLVITCFLVVLLGILTTVLVSSRQTAQPEISKQDAANLSRNVNQTSQTVVPATIAYPRISFSSYTNNAPLPQSPSSVKTYEFQAQFTDNDAQALATKLNFAKTVVSQKGDIVSVIDPQIQSAGVVQFNTKTGGWTYIASGTEKVVSQNSVGDIEAFLANRGIIDDTVSCTTSYKRQTATATFVECHRDWNRVGLPILNSISTINLPLEKKVSELQVADTAGAVRGGDIYSASDGSDGYIRSNEFNSLTAMIDDSGMLLAISSTIRPIVTTDTKQGISLKTPQEALEELATKGAEFTSVLPTGDGIVDLRKLYPSDSVVGKNAVVSDIGLAYLEAPGTRMQSCLAPYYVIRGRATLSGYDVNFVQLVSSVKNSSCDSALPPLLTSKVKGETTIFEENQGSSIKYKTFPAGNPVSLTPTPTKTSESTTPSVVLTQPPTKTTPIPQSSCPAFTKCLAFADNTQMCWFPDDPNDPAAQTYCGTTEQYGQNCNKARFFYYVVPKGQELQSGVYDLPLPSCERGKTWPTEYPCVNRDIYDKWANAQTAFCLPYRGQNGQILPPQVNCPVPSADQFAQKTCYAIAPGSPYINLYGISKPIDVQLMPTVRLTYVSPELSSENTWHVSKTGDSTLYYEYNKVPLAKQLQKTIRSGETITIPKVSVINTLAKVILPRIGMSQKDQQSLLEEVNRELPALTGSFVQIGFIDQDVLNQFLPLTFSRSVPLYRVHLFLKSTNTSGRSSMQNIPHVGSEVERVVEVGAIVVE